MLSAAPKNSFSMDYRISGDDLSPLLFDLSNWRESAELEIDGVSYRFSRRGLLSGDFILASPTGLLARASKTSAWSSRFEIETEGCTFELRRTSVWGRSFTVREGGAVVGTIRPESIWSRKAILDFPATWSRPLQIFVFWLAVLIWNRDQAAAS